MMRPNTAINSRLQARFRRGSAYILVLGIALLLTVVGMGTLLTTRLAGRQSSNSADWQQAGVLAQSMVEQAMSYLNAQVAANPTTWRNSITSYTTGNAWTYTQTSSGNTSGWVVKDDVDGNFSDDYADPFQLTGIARVGQTTRYYTVHVVTAGSPLDVLRCGMHCGANVTVSGTVVAGAGPISSNGQTTTSNPIYGSVETVSQNGSSGNVKGTLTTGVPVKTMPSDNLYNLYLAKATAIPGFAAGGTISSMWVNSSIASPDAVYSLAVTGGNKTLTINSCRITGTLIVSLANKDTLNLTGPILWEPARADYPILIVNATSSNTVNITGSNTWLSESTVGADLNGNGTTTDDLAPQYRGLIHIIGSSCQVNVSGNAFVQGCLVSEAPVTISGQSSFISDSNLYAHPPLGYGKGDQLAIVPGSWVWDTAP